MFPTLLDDQLLVNEFQFFIEEIEKSHDVNLAGSQRYPVILSAILLHILIILWYLFSFVLISLEFPSGSLCFTVF